MHAPTAPANLLHLCRRHDNVQVEEDGKKEMICETPAIMEYIVQVHGEGTLKHTNPKHIARIEVRV